ncbi:hypothetical protein [Paenibacillus nasutitermitis]|uniref:Uncharacterized protein n=1 Tax=Paenibacillus nasutitermitis TaxID=1652958 RepID=A0A917DM92_9BACL|nr:hypothetical protein [Paenibacillus nasutitermitis]GGD48956.1 hypothetical protein GCM10010911_03130 [Paenibacillus nasutitermitis]
MAEVENPICPWCQTEIVWDEEIGPERHCPHCENELTGYRTVQVGLDGLDEEVEDSEEIGENWDEEEDEAASGNNQPDLTGLSHYSRDRLALDETMDRLLDDQLEAPECPSCREFMLEAGTQTITETQFQPRTPEALTEPLLTTPFRIVLYFCPSCFHTEQRLGVQEQERLVKLLTKAVADGN